MLQSEVRSCGICGGQNGGIGAGFLQALQFPLPVLISPSTPHPLIILPSMLCSLRTETIVKWH
jgi:hypothetical protein